MKSSSLSVALLLFLALGASDAKFTISGVSSGAFFAVQMHVAYSADVTGAAIIAGGPFYCAKDSEMLALTDCMSTPYLLDVDSLISYTKEQATSGTIDSTSNMMGSKAWIFSGTLDYVVDRGVVEKLVTYYQSFLDASDITTEYSIPSAHAWVTKNYGNPCYELGSPYLNNCNYDSAGAFLKWFYPDLKTEGTAIAANLKTFSQASFITGSSNADMAPNGYIYIPTGCQQNANSCMVHVAVHGCKMAYTAIGTDFVANTGLNNWAESNNIIVIYPQVTTAAVTNPQGCWDWWGYSGSNYAQKSGIQMAAVYKMATNPPVKSAQEIVVA